MGHRVSESTRRKMSERMLSNNPMSGRNPWNKNKHSDTIGYHGIHHITRQLFAGAKCSMCGGTNKIESALRKEATTVYYSKEGWKYSRDVKDYFPLCAKCHRLYDEAPGRRGKQRT